MLKEFREDLDRYVFLEKKLAFRFAYETRTLGFTGVQN